MSGFSNHQWSNPDCDCFGCRQDLVLKEKSMTPKDDGKKVELGLIECQCKETKVAPGHFCPRCLWAHPNPRATPPPDAERVKYLDDCYDDLPIEVRRAISDVFDNAGTHDADYSVAKSAGEIISQLRARPALDVENVMGEIEKLVAELVGVSSSPYVSQRIRKIRTTLKTALGEKEKK